LLDGCPLTIKSIPTDVNCLQPVRTWNKLDRKNLDSKTKQLFVKSATGYVLTKSNKLTVFSMQDTNDDKLKQLNSLQTQLKLLRAHMQNYDILDMFTIIVPTNVLKSPLLTDYYFDLLRDYAKLDDNIVANSCAWYNMWVKEEYVQENMAHTYTLLQNNTTELLGNSDPHLFITLILSKSSFEIRLSHSQDCNNSFSVQPSMCFLFHAEHIKFHLLMLFLT
jgi:hypothetical protein